MPSLSLLQQHRLNYQPKLPLLLSEIEDLTAEPKINPNKMDALKEYFPRTADQPVLEFIKSNRSILHSALNVGVVFSGGQAPGGNNVIAGLFDALKKLNKQSQLIGFLDGPSGILKNKTVEIDQQLLTHYRNQGGFDMLGSGRTKIETSDQFAAAAETAIHHNLDGLIIIGGDDSNTNAAFLAEYFKSKNIKTSVVGVPKTIDGDLKNEFIEISFGFDTACKIYSEIIGNILKDMLSAKKYYYFIKLMGRSASHVTLECALQTHVNMALIGEEIAERKMSLSDVVQHIVEMICKRAEKGRDYGTVLIPEGIIEFIPEFKQMIHELNGLLASNQPHIKKIENEATTQAKAGYLSQHLSNEAYHCFQVLPESIQEQLLFDRDPHGNVQVSKIETERLLISLVEKELFKKKQAGQYAGKFSSQPLFCGYEGRSGLPSNFDCNYCYALGFTAALLINSGASGYMSCVRNLTQSVENWKISGIPISDMLHFEIREGKKKAVIRKSLVNLKAKPFITFANLREKWQLEDDYCSPGPIQFEGPSEITESISHLLQLEQING